MADVLSEPVPQSSLHEILERMQYDIPEFRATEIVHRSEGLTVATLAPKGGYDGAAAAAYYCDFLNACVTAVRGYGAAPDLEDVLVTTDEHYILLRPIVGTPYMHLCIVGKSGNLGIAKVVMRRNGPLLARALPT